MSSNESFADKKTVSVLLEVQYDESSEEPPMEEWSSLLIEIPEYNAKRLLYEENLYHPGSGEICTKYVPISASSVFRHPYYQYPSVQDPGILKALLRPEEMVIYPDDGQELYLNICNETNQCPVRIFYKGLLDEEIDLSYYGVNPNNVCAMSRALKFNNIVKVFNLTDNFLNNDSCYHLGEMLEMNTTLTELNLSGCRIGPDGAKRLFAGLKSNKNLISLNLNRNNLGEKGMQHLADAIFRGLNARQIYLSYNNITGTALIPLTEAFETHNQFTHLDLSWNSLFGAGTVQFLTKLAENQELQVLNLSWNALSGPRIGTSIRKNMNPNTREINLSNNQLSGQAVGNIIAGLGVATKLVALNLSYNPLTPNDALKMVTKVKQVEVKVKNVYMDNVNVTEEFVGILDSYQNIKSKKNTVVTYGGVIKVASVDGPDPRDLALNRVEFLCKKSKNNPIDIALFVYQMIKEKKTMLSAKEFDYEMRKGKIPIDQELIDQLVDVFEGPKTGKVKNINIALLADFVKRKWPERKLPPTPPPELQLPKKEKGKGKKKK